MRTCTPIVVTCLLISACSPKEDAGETTASSSTASSSGTTGEPLPTTSDGETGTASTGDSTTSGETVGTGDTGETGDTSTGEPACEPGAFIALEEALVQVLQDLSTVPEQARPFTRYISLVQLHNAGLCEPEITLVRQALGKLVNSLSSEPTITVPAAVDGAQLLLRVDLRDYGWDSPVENFGDTWELLAGTNPYAFEPFGEVTVELLAVSETRFPLLPAEALVSFASRPPVYYDALRLPNSLTGLAQQLGVNLEDQLAEELATDLDAVARAAIHESDVTDFHRILERHQLPDAAGRALWRTFDFASEAGQSNIFLNPFDFVHDVGEVLFTLPNGLHGYMIVDDKGARLTEMPVNIEQDFLFADGVVRAGASCMGCHTQGIIKAQDDLRFEIDNGMNGELFDADTTDKIRNAYPIREAMDALMTADRDRYLDASMLAGVPAVGLNEPVTTTILAFEAPLDINRAAGELWMPPEDLLKNVGKLPNDLAKLSDGTVTREVFTANFAESVCVLGFGETPACP